MPLTATTGRSAERARRELAATARTASKRAAPAARAAVAGAPLTAQEAQVARLARDGLSNPENSRSQVATLSIGTKELDCSAEDFQRAFIVGWSR